MSFIELIKIIVAAIGGVIGTLIPSIIKIRKAIKQYKEAETIANKEKSKSFLFERLKTYIELAENKYLNKDKGLLKKQFVLKCLKDIAEVNNIYFDEEYWSDCIDKIIDLTKKVNIK